MPVVTFLVLLAGFQFLKDCSAPKGVIAIVAVVWGVGGVGLLYMVSNWFVEKLGDKWRARLQPFVFVGPAIVILIWFLALPTVRTFYKSLFDADSQVFVGLQNYARGLHQPQIMFTAFRNNLMWIVFGATLAVVFGLLIAVLADRSKFEHFAKSMIFLPMAISMVGGAIIWKMIYAVNPEHRHAQRRLHRPDGEPAGRLDGIRAAAAVEQPVPHRHHDLAPGRLCDDALLGRH